MMKPDTEGKYCMIPFALWKNRTVHGHIKNKDWRERSDCLMRMEFHLGAIEVFWNERVGMNKQCTVCFKIMTLMHLITLYKISMMHLQLVKELVRDVLCVLFFPTDCPIP